MKRVLYAVVVLALALLALGGAVAADEDAKPAPTPTPVTEPVLGVAADPIVIPDDPKTKDKDESKTIPNEFQCRDSDGDGKWDKGSHRSCANLETRDYNMKNEDKTDDVVVQTYDIDPGCINGEMNLGNNLDNGRSRADSGSAARGAGARLARANHAVATGAQVGDKVDLTVRRAIAGAGLCTPATGEYFWRDTNQDGVGDGSAAMWAPDCGGNGVWDEQGHHSIAPVGRTAAGYPIYRHNGSVGIVVDDQSLIDFGCS